MARSIDRLRTFARGMRRKPTEAEQRLWHILRAKRLEGLKFRRQVPVGDYIADFASFRHRLIVEVDGSQHGESAYDASVTPGCGRRDFRWCGFGIMHWSATPTAWC
jgi:very-short-patch-repair endonuclease